MANTKLLEREIHNLADPVGRRITSTFGLVYQTPPDKLRQVEALAKTAVEAQPGCKLVRCVITAMAPSALDHELVWDDKAIDPDRLSRHRAGIILALIEALGREGIAFAYPTQTTYTAAPDGTLVMPWAPPATPKPAKT
jgi:small-conductance mechanosensitive channel